MLGMIIGQAVMLGKVLRETLTKGKWQIYLEIAIYLPLGFFTQIQADTLTAGDRLCGRPLHLLQLPQQKWKKLKVVVTA